MNSILISCLISWKPSARLEDIAKFCDFLKTKELPNCSVALPYLLIGSVPALDTLRWGMQEMESLEQGRFTAPVAAQLIKASGGQFVLVGTAQNRASGEENRSMHAKIKAAQEQGIEPVLCIGETWEEKQAERSAEVLTVQLAKALEGLEFASLNVVYEAPWIAHAPYLCSKEELIHAYQFAKELIQSIYGEKVKVLCPIPKEFADPFTTMAAIPADGYYLTDPVVAS